MTRQGLLSTLKSMTHDDRMRRMVEVGVEAARGAARQSSDVEATLTALEHGGFYERRLALQSCFGSMDGARVLRSVDDPSRMVRGLALRLVALCGEDQVQQALQIAPFKRRRVLLRRLLKRRRQAVIDAFLQTLSTRGDADFNRLLPYGSSGLVQQHAEAFIEGAGAGDWARLARLHPTLAAAWLLDAARQSTEYDARLTWRAITVLPNLSETQPGAALELVRALLPLVPLESLPLQRLAERRPAEMADLILAAPGRTRLDFNRVAHRLDDARLLALVERRPDVLSRTALWLRRLDAARRLAIYGVCERGWRDDDGAVARDLVALLPRAQREREARRHLNLPALATRPAQRLPYVAFLPYEEARALLDPFVRNPDPDLRAVALTALAFGVRFERERVPDLLKVVSDRKNEQDPIRGAMLGGLAALPPAVWRAEHLEPLGQIFRQALDASDLSQSTAGGAERLILALLPRFPTWSAQWLATLVRERGTVSFYDLQNRLTDADVRNIAPALLPVIESWETREREGHIIALARSLGRRLRVWHELVDLLERLLRRTRTSYVAPSVLGLFAQHRRDRLGALIPALLQEDKSWITLEPVYTYLHRRRQDLITDFLGRQAYKGRFSTGRTRFVLPLTDGFARWLPNQQEIFEKTLREVTQDEARDSPALLRVINQLTVLPDVAPRRLVQLADARNPKPVTRDAALRALGRRDNGDGVPVLIEAMGDERARIAIYVLRRALLEMPAPAALVLLHDVPLEKVTVAKEVVRLLGELAGDEAYRTLLEWNERDLHRDVRVALLRALWSHVEREETWPILERAAASSDAAVATIVGRIPADRLSPSAARRLTLLVAGLLRHSDPKVRLDALARCAQLPLTDREQALLSPLLDALNSPLPDECRGAAGAVFATYVGRQATLVGEVSGRILPNRRALSILVAELQRRLTWSPGHLGPTARAVLEALAPDPITARLRVELAGAALPAAELADWLTRLAAANELHADALSAALSVLEGTRREAADLEILEAVLSGAGDERLRRLALAALLASCRAPRGWSDERLARLRAFRADLSPLVAAKAQFTFVAAQE